MRKIYLFLSRGLKSSAASRPKTMAAAVPPEAALKPPVKAPSRPCSATAFFTPFASRFPKPVSGTAAPAPAQSAKGW